MILPVRFDQNEWFLLITLLVCLLIFFWLPTRFPRSITISIVVMTIFVGQLVDIILSLEPLDFYDINDTSQFDLFDFLALIIYGCFGYFLAYLYDLFRPQSLILWLYITLWALVSTGYEWISIQFGVFHYKGWQVMYSFIFYLAVISVMLLYFRFLQKEHAKIDENHPIL